jgi:hypothetical protein
MASTPPAISSLFLVLFGSVMVLLAFVDQLGSIAPDSKKEMNKIETRGSGVKPVTGGVFLRTKFWSAVPW